jgi:Flp pilus assembly protein TadB
MKKSLSRVVDFLFVLLLSLAVAIPQDVFAQNHVVSSTDLQKDVAAASASRQQHVAQVESFLSSTEAQQAMKSAHINYRQVKIAVRQLNNDELARLSARSDTAQKDFAAGTLSNRDLLIIVVAIAALILIIVAVRS